MTSSSQRPDRHGRLWLPWRTLLIGGVVLGVYWMLGPAPALLVWQPAAFTQYEIWRLLSGHLVHSDLNHLVMDGLGLLLLGVLFEPVLQQRLWHVLLGSALLIDACLWIALPHLQAYCGLSGLLNALLAAGLYLAWLRDRHWLYPAIGAAALIKILVETYSQQALFSDTLWPSVPQAHLVGMLAGILIALWIDRQTDHEEACTSPDNLGGLPPSSSEVH